jgi:hypothetical protein
MECEFLALLNTGAKRRVVLCISYELAKKFPKQRRAPVHRAVGERLCITGCELEVKWDGTRISTGSRQTALGGAIPLGFGAIQVVEAGNEDYSIEEPIFNRKPRLLGGLFEMSIWNPVQ